MIRQLEMTEEVRRCGRVLIESDRCYFEMAADVEQLNGGQLAWMPGLQELAASAVIQRIDVPLVEYCWADWLPEIEQALCQRSVAWSRVYFDECPNEVGQRLSAAGYQRRVEVGFLAPLGHPPPPSDVRLVEVIDEGQWDAKRSIHEQAMDGPDGYTNQADLWVEMERRKCRTRKMRSYLIQHCDKVVGTVGAIVCEDLLRLKNILIAPQYRRRGLGVATVVRLWQLSESEYSSRFGVFGVEGAKGEKLYRRAGMQAVTQQFEWSKRLSGDQ